MSHTWTALLIDQLDFYLGTHLRPRLVGLTDEEYFWEPVEDCWSVRQGPDGSWRVDGGGDGPGSPPFTTIAWRLTHLAVANLGMRANAFFGDNPDGATMFDPRNAQAVPGSAAEATALLDATYERWRAGIAGLDDTGFLEPLGPRGSFYANNPMAALVMHVNRECMHHGGEIGVLRDLYARR